MPRSFSSPQPTLNDCIQSVIEVASVSRLRHSDSVLGNMLRVHLGQVVLSTFMMGEATTLLTTEPLLVLIPLPGPGGHRERCQRCTRIARQALALYSLSPECRDHAITDVVRVGYRAYLLAADEVGSYDRWIGDLWWEMGDGFLDYASVIASSSRLLDG